ncbi:MAG: PfkB family carbohydrate kinase, partial [Pontibacter sp.]|nr:PfkB family carbohydrate kinase [Pontibacter sp.]
LKPNLGELAALAGKEEQISALEQEEIAKQVLGEGKCKVLVVSLGPRGAMLASDEGISYIVPPTMPMQSAVGAGDSMVAGMVLGLQRGYSLEDMARYGVAAGTAATMTPGTELCRKEDTEEIYKWLMEHQV